jgi:uncharacterized membrane protein YqjE
MGWAEFELAGLAKVLGALAIIVGIGLAIYELSLNNMLTAVALLLVFLVLGLVMISWGSYSRKQNTPMGRVEDTSG